MLVNILLIDGFDEEIIVQLVRELRRFQFRVSLVGLSRHAVRGRFGLKIEPELNLTDAMQSRERSHLVISDGYIDAPGLISDPRVHRWIEMTTSNHRCLVATMPLGASFLAKLDLFKDHLPKPQWTQFSIETISELAVQLNDKENEANMQPLLHEMS